MWSRLLVGLSITGGLCGFAALLWIFHLIPVETIVSVDKVEYIYEKLSLHMWFLEMILLVVGLAAAVLGFVGYQSIKDEAVKKATNEAVKKATEEARREFMRWDDNLRGLSSADHQVQPDSTEEEVR